MTTTRERLVLYLEANKPTVDDVTFSTLADIIGAVCVFFCEEIEAILAKPRSCTVTIGNITFANVQDGTHLLVDVQKIVEKTAMDTCA